MTSAPAKRLNPWPIALIAFFALFIASIIAFIVFSTFHRVDLVTPDYYEQEIRYQAQLDRLDRTAALAEGASIALDPATQHLRIQLPPTHAASQPRGSVAFYRPSAAHLDRRFPLLLDPAGTQVLDLGGFAHGLWRVRVAWQVGAQEFFREEKIQVGAPPP